MSKSEELLREAFTPEIVDAIVDKLQQAYEANFDHYDPSIGHDAMSFGLLVYKSKVHFLSQTPDEFEDIEILQRNPGFSMQVGRYRMATYCAGHSGDADIESSFPHNKTRAAMLTARNQAQLRLPFRESVEPPDDSMCREVILADIGNPTDGLCKVFLGIPIQKTPEGRITKWGTTLEIWTNDMVMPVATSTESVNRPPVEEAVPITVSLKEAKKAKEEK